MARAAYVQLMMRLLRSLGIVVAGLAFSAGSCNSAREQHPDSGVVDLDAGQMVDGGEVVDAGDPDAGPVYVPNPYCQALDLRTIPFSDATPGDGGTARGDLAGDFTLTLADGSSWNLKDNFPGCESYVFLPDTILISPSGTASIWTSDLDGLIATSPQNVHYFFFSEAGSDAAANASTQAMQAYVTTQLKTMTPTDADHWQQHLHVVGGRAQTLQGWLKTSINAWGFLGFAIDRSQHLRGVGMFADVTRPDSSPAASNWPFKNNLAYAANEAIYMNAQAAQLLNLGAEGATVVPIFTGQVLSEFAETDAVLPADLTPFDTLEVEVTQRCPDPNALEFNSCGAWDYIAELDLIDPAAAGEDAGVSHELARFITSYHRETHWVEDVSPMLAQLAPGGVGGMRHFRWNFAPPWNTQPTATELTLRLSNRRKGYWPSQITEIYTGGTLNDQYNTPDAGHGPVTVPIPADTTRAELWVLVTGHGSDPYGCAEFCDHGHVFTVNGATSLIDFPMASTPQGCIAEEANGMSPNQGGTWWYGRGGWCPGKQVDPWVFDVTANVQPGIDAAITYEGLYQGRPPPANGGGNIDLAAYLVTYH